MQGQDNASYDGPIIDVHLHAYMPQSYKQAINPVTGRKPICATSAEHLLATKQAMSEFHIVLGLVSGPLEAVDIWRESSKGLFIAGAGFDHPGEISIEELRSRLEDNRIGLIGEIGAQYEGLSPSDTRFENYYELAEEFDVPVGIHTGSSSPRTIERRPNFRIRFGNPLLLEDMLVKYPSLRVYMMHGGLPWLTETLAMLHMYPDLYIDIAVKNWIIPREKFHPYLKALIDAGYGKRIMFGSDQMYPDLYIDIAVKNWIIPREKFHPYLKALIDAGYGKRIMFGSDQMYWPEAIGLAIEGIESAEFLTLEQKADIFYHNAARFLGLSESEIAKHHGH
jgi:predicted TIM-barrel fold metal-dependent hydrolase